MKRIAACIGFVCAACSASGQDTTEQTGIAADAPMRQPNIVVILADDLGYGDLGSYGGDLIDTPRLDAMAEKGVRLTSYYAPANVCTPSRAGLLTGRQPIRYGLARGVIHPSSDHGLPPEEVTIAEALTQIGYETMMVGKWHLGHQDGLWPTDQGFGHFFGVPYSNDMTPFPLMAGKDVIEETADQTTLTKRYTEEAVAFIEGADAPFFLYLAHTFPHIPLFASEAFAGASAAGPYGDATEEIDWSTGEILDTLEREGLTEDTLVVFTSDNGPWFEGSAGGLRGRKGGSYEGGHRVPFLALWPNTLPPGAVIDAPVTGLDLFPTLARLGGAALPAAEIDGADVWDVLRDDTPSPHEAEGVLLFNEDQITGLRQGDWHLVAQDYYKTYDVSLTSVGYPLLFDVRADPAMRYSQAARQPERAREMLDAIAAARERYDVPPPPPPPLPAP